jgi:hypothetical protein
LGNNINYNFACCVTFVTGETSVTLPPGMLGNGGYYLISVEADSLHGGTANTATLPVGYTFTTPGVIIASSN